MTEPNQNSDWREEKKAATKALLKFILFFIILGGMVYGLVYFWHDLNAFEIVNKRSGMKISWAKALAILACLYAGSLAVKHLRERLRLKKFIRDWGPPTGQ